MNPQRGPRAHEPRRSLLLDTPSLVYRAFFAVPDSVKGAAGEPVNAVRGCLDMIARLWMAQGPTEVIATMDADWRPAFRVAAYPGFKEARPEEPQDLSPQFLLLNTVLDAFGIPRAEAPGLEADDVLATLARGVQGEDRSLIVTGDRDLLCLVRDPQVRVLFTVKGVTQLKVFDDAAIEEAYGIPPRLYVEFATLRGDPSDGLPGVKGIGPTRATKLLREFGSIEGILENLDRIPPAQRAAFEASGPYLEAMKVVVPPVADAEVEMTEPHPPDRDLLMEIAQRYNMEGPIARLLHALTGAGLGPGAPDEDVPFPEEEPSPAY